MLLHSSDFSKNSFKDVSLLIGLSTDIDFSSKYKFKISKQYATGPIIRTITTDEEVHCEFNYDEVCYLMVDFYKVNPFEFYAYDEYNSDLQLVLYASSYTTSKIQSVSYLSNINAYLPRRDYYGNGYMNSDTNFLEVSHNSNKIFLYAIYNPYKSSSVRVIFKSTYLSADRYAKLFYGLSYVANPGTLTYTIEMMLLTDGIQLSVDYCYQKIITFEKTGHAYLNVKDQQLRQFVHKKNGKTIVGYFPYSKINKVFIGENKIINVGNVFPHAFYYPVGKLKVNLSCKIKITELIKTEDLINQDTFELIAYIVDKEFLDSYNVDQSITIKGEKVDISSVGIEYMISIDMNSIEKYYEKYVFVKISQSESNNNEYTEGAILVSLSYSIQTLPILKASTYTYGTLHNEPISYNYKNSDRINKFQFIISSAPNINDYLENGLELSFENKKIIPSFQNSPALKISSVQKEGQKIIEVNFYDSGTTFKDFIISIAKSPIIAEEFDIDFVIDIKTKTTGAFNEFYDFSFDRTLSSSIILRDIMLNFTLPVPPKRFMVNNITYSINIYKANNFRSTNDVDSLYANNTSVWIQNNTLQEYNGENIKIKLPNPKDVFIQVIAFYNYYALDLSDYEEHIYNYMPVFPKDKKYTSIEMNKYIYGTANNEYIYHTLLINDNATQIFVEFISDYCTLAHFI